jgi:hypothetical protein
MSSEIKLKYVTGRNDFIVTKLCLLDARNVPKLRYQVSLDALQCETDLGLRT